MFKYAYILSLNFFNVVEMFLAEQAKNKHFFLNLKKNTSVSNLKTAEKIGGQHS